MKVEGAGLNLTRATLDAATKYPWASDGRKKYGVYADDADVFAWVREGVTGEERCLESQVMDWADDVAYSVHDLEDGIVGGLIDLSGLRRREEIAPSPSWRPAVLRRLQIGPRRGVRGLLLAEQWWPARYDGTGRAQAQLKHCTSSLIGRFCRAAEDATRAQFGDEDAVRLRRRPAWCRSASGSSARC